MKVSPATLAIGAIVVPVVLAVAWLTMMVLTFPPTQPGVTFKVVEVPEDTVTSPTANLTEHDLGTIPPAVVNVIRQALTNGTASADLTADEYVQWEESFDEIARRPGVEFPAYIRVQDRIFLLDISMP